MTRRPAPATVGVVADASESRRALELELFGQRLTVVSDSDPDTVREVVNFVNARMESIRDASGRVTTDQVALLAALNIAEELHEVRRKHGVLQDEVRGRAHRLLTAIDAVAERVAATEPEGGAEA